MKDLISSLIHRVRTSDFLRHNAIFFTGSLAISVLNYLYYPVLGRLLPTSQFGEVQALVSLFLQATIFLNVVTSVAVNIVTNESSTTLRSRIITELERLGTLIIVAFLLAALIFLPQLQAFLHFSAPLPFVILGLSLAISMPLSLRSAYLRGVNAFTKLSIAGIISAGSKLIISALLVVLGLGTSGAIAGLVIAQTISFAYARHNARRLGLHPAARPFLRAPDIALIKPQLPYASLVLIVSLVTTTQFSFDILVVKHYFSPEVAGAYAGVATVARIIYFLTGSVAAVLLSTVKLGAPLATNRGHLRHSIMLQTALGGTALLLFMVAPQLVVKLLIGSRYLALAGLLPELSLALFIIAFVNLLLTYDLALRRWSSASIALAGSAATVWLVLANHATPAAVVHSVLFGSSIMLIFRILATLRRRLAGL